MSTFLLTRSEIQTLLEVPALIPPLKDGFIHYSQRHAHQHMDVILGDYPAQHFYT